MLISDGPTHRPGSDTNIARATRRANRRPRDFIPHQRQSQNAMGLAASLIVALPLVAASPAQAATKCGATKTVRVSIHYQACDSNDTSGHKVAGYAKIQNNHGSTVTIRIQDGYTANGGSIAWNPNTPSNVDVAAGASKVAGFPGWVGCHQGDTIGYVFRVWDNRTDAWGATSYATPVTCP